VAYPGEKTIKAASVYRCTNQREWLAVVWGHC